MITLKEGATMNDVENVLKFHLPKLGAFYDKKKNQWVFQDNNEPMLWENIVENRPNLLSDYNVFRKELVDTILRLSASQNNCEDECSAMSVGSVTLTSDYDITVTGPKAPKIVNDFNQTFRDIFNEESGDIFDTNLYGASQFQKIDVGHFDLFQHNLDYFSYVKEDPFDGLGIKQQRLWAFVKLNLHLKEQDRVVFEQLLSPVVKKVFKNSIDLKNRLDNIVILGKVFDRKNLKDMNLMYEKSLFELKLRLNDMKTGKTPRKSTRRKYKDAISRANYYGSETYFTQGAFMHVVGEVQSKITSIPISRNEYIDSFLENVGDAIKEVNHFQHQSNVGDSEKICGKLIRKMSKYYSRAMDALIKSLGTSTSGKIKNLIAELKEHYKLSEFIRSNIRGKAICDAQSGNDNCVPPNIANEYTLKFLELIKLDDCENIRQKLLELAAEGVNEYYQSVNVKSE